MLPDGDLWAHIERLLDSRSRQSVAVSKLKGHATMHDVLVGNIALQDMRGNQCADSLASDGRRIGKRIGCVLGWLVRERRAYSQFSAR
eukprot:8397601-Alexandrium_andersonii.AAC.1